MEYAWLLLNVIVFTTVFLVTTRPLYIRSLKVKAVKIADRLGLSLHKLVYSYEQMVFFTALPSHLPQLKQAKKEDICLKLDYHSMFFPRLKGVKVIITKGKYPYNLAYLPIKDFRLPSLDRLSSESHLSGKEYLIISSYLASHPDTLDEIRDEVFRKMQFKDMKQAE
ncbi:hypothetical protein KP77_32850 [Jeotgalibacillus alimentarius]|uniref:Uncharacterized protein n=1 Tax=Jeotgalibacillus alimentarius TaxID=135826 RepID=A0A0C2RPA4_9BACL|nr:hypothetical protein [Jeotgalibacillus alimentarius]KIL43579.1 hypothetical protein KP77_32850 [Jeotgalibacillus alimentarius]